jgi:hypothetical protein
LSSRHRTASIASPDPVALALLESPLVAWGRDGAREHRLAARPSSRVLRGPW